jgi:hypothetical protein
MQCIPLVLLPRIHINAVVVLRLDDIHMFMT